MSSKKLENSQKGTSQSKAVKHAGDGVIRDKRFAHIQNDPKFSRLGKDDKKVRVDKRFKAMFQKKEFCSTGGLIDAKGRPVSQKSDKDDIKHLYKLEDDDGDEGRMSSDESENENLQVPEDEGKFQWNVESSEEESDYEYESDPDVEKQDLWQDDAKIPLGNASKRIAVMNCDWRHMKALDLMAIFQSFCSSSGKGYVVKTEIYPSEFGRKMMEQEEKLGPKGIWKEEALVVTDEDDRENGKENNENMEIKKPKRGRDAIGDINNNLTTKKKKREFDDEDDGYDQQKLREYEMNRLRYYYAVVTFDSLESGNAAYENCDGLDIGSSSNPLDLRFIPEDLAEFPYSPTDVCTKVPADYEMKDFVTRSVAHSNLKVTWDETNTDRVRDLQRKLPRGELTNADLAQYIASESEEDSDEDEERIQKMRNLLAGIGSNDTGDGVRAGIFGKNFQRKPNGDIEVTFKSGFDEDEDDDDNDLLSKKKEPINIGETLAQKRAEKKKSKKRQKKGEAEEEQRDDLNPRAKKRSKEESQQLAEYGLVVDDESAMIGNFKMNVHDSRFDMVFNNPKFAIDPTHPKFKQSQGNEKLLKEYRSKKGFASK
eukprot:CAMPEP_0115010702 /NCGR_PEP_ID=MMETSP0216-20121206/23490_1 /TAXON_ID=223996 /ORGANISM="Protocruzia adherens, Strain Boccale" /LENGTH=596 /DNA_ID=CAMNT_0002379001 /DNA_START=81 /DNA_END=1871 /DNA_ORIENTATION=-